MAFRDARRRTARAFTRDLPETGIHPLDTGHFALEDHAPVIAGHVRRFLTEHGQATG